MTDFREAFQTGLDAYEKAESARKEIAEVLDELARQVHEESSGLIRIECQERYDPGDEPPSMLQQQLEREASRGLGLAGGMLSNSLRPPRRAPRTYQALIATLPSHQKDDKLCEYELSEQGYPVTLIYNKIRDRCHDRASLELGLQNLLRHPITGGRLRALLSLAKEEEEDRDAPKRSQASSSPEQS